ncbi:hypothetical protein ON010_g16211 [Phytophthora cinnamomi]|nr:hypothetical protein ON010_g16211 [Phytophthora cinnamomi]
MSGEIFLGAHARGYRNRNGYALAKFSDSYRLYATNTSFQKRAAHKTTWTQRRTDYCIHNQILGPRAAAGSAWTPGPAEERPPIQTTSSASTFESLENASSTMRTFKTSSRSPSTRITTAQRGSQHAPPCSKKDDDDMLKELSTCQRNLQLRIYNDYTTNTAALRSERNAILHQIQLGCCDLANIALDDKIKNIESCSHTDTARFYEAVRTVTPRRARPLLLYDEKGRYILHQPTANNLVRSHCQAQFSIPERPSVAPDLEPRELSCPITPGEFRQALRRLNNRRSSGPDDIPGELLKYAADALAPRLAEIVDSSFARGEPLGLGAGTLLCLPKPNKPQGKCSSLCPIALLNTIHKAISVVVLNSIAAAVDTFQSPHQSGYRRNRNTADAVWTHHWMVLATFLPDDEVRLIRRLLANTTLSLRAGRTTLDPFEGNTGTPQGDSPSPVSCALQAPGENDRVCRRRRLHLQRPVMVDVIPERTPAILARCSLQMNITKTEITEIRRHTQPKGATRLTRAAEERWRSAKKLGSLLGGHRGRHSP